MLASTLRVHLQKYPLSIPWLTEPSIYKLNKPNFMDEYTPAAFKDIHLETEQARWTFLYKNLVWMTQMVYYIHIVECPNVTVAEWFQGRGMDDSKSCKQASQPSFTYAERADLCLCALH